jgi:hypothetical protein
MKDAIKIAKLYVHSTLDYQAAVKLAKGQGVSRSSLKRHIFKSAMVLHDELVENGKAEISKSTDYSVNHKIEISVRDRLTDLYYLLNDINFYVDYFEFIGIRYTFYKFCRFDKTPYL